MRLSAFGFVAVGVGAIYTTSMIDRGMHYKQIPAQISSTSIDCYVEGFRSKLVEKDTNQKAYMDCEIAPYAAEKFGYTKSDIKTRVKLQFTYKSPVDGSLQKGTHEIDNPHASYKNGQSIQIYGHTSVPKKYRWS